MHAAARECTCASVHGISRTPGPTEKDQQPSPTNALSQGYGLVSAGTMQTMRDSTGSKDRMRIVTVVRATGWIVGVVAAIAMLTTSWGGVGPAATFSWHPAMMAVGFSGLMTEGMLAYVAKPANGQQQIRAVQRAWHASLQAGAFVAVMLGFIL